MKKVHDKDISRFFDGEGEALPPEIAAASEALREEWKQYGSWLREEEIDVPYAAEHAAADALRTVRSEERTGPVLPWFTWKPALSMAAAVVLGFGFWLWGGNPVAQAYTTVEFVDTDLPGAAAMVYKDEDSGSVVIWVIEEEPEENESI